MLIWEYILHRNLINNCLKVDGKKSINFGVKSKLLYLTFVTWILLTKSFYQHTMSAVFLPAFNVSLLLISSLSQANVFSLMKRQSSPILLIPANYRTRLIFSFWTVRKFSEDIHSFSWAVTEHLFASIIPSVCKIILCIQNPLLNLFNPSNLC